MTIHKHSTIAEYDRILSDVKDWVSDSFSDTTLDEFCTHMRYSRRSVQRALLNHGTGWRKEIMAARMNAAADYLATTDNSINDIANGLGYNSSSLFIKHFTDWFGHTPMVWRRNERRQHSGRTREVA